MFNLVFGLFMLLAGGFFFLSAIKNWDYAFTHGSPGRVANLLGRNAARWMYGFLGGLTGLGGVGLLLSALSKLSK